MTARCRRQCWTDRTKRLTRAATVLLIASAAWTIVPQHADAFEIFGFKFFEPEDTDDAIVDPLRYTVTLTAPGADADLTKKLTNASALVADADKPVSGSLGLIAKAKADRQQLVASLFESAHYDGLVDILLAGRPIETLAPDTEFTTRPVPVTITVTPGAVYTLGTVRLEGDAADLSPADFELTPGSAAGSLRILKAEALIVRRLKEEGRPLAKVTSRQAVADHDTRQLDVTMTVAAGPIANYGDTTVRGTVSMDPGFTAYMTDLPKGRLYSPKEVEDARERLINLGVFSSVTVKEADSLDTLGGLPIHVEVSERKLRYYGVGASYSTLDGLGLEGYWGHRNLFGHAETLRIDGSISGVGANSRRDEEGNTSNSLTDLTKLNYQLGATFAKPGVVGPDSKYFAAAKVVYEHPDAYDRFAVRASNGLSYELTPTQTVSAEFAVEYSRITDFYEKNKDFLILSVPLQYVFDNRDNRLDPKTGFRLLAFAEPSYDALDSVPFVKLRGEGSAYQALDMSKSIVLAERLAIGSILGADVSQIPADRRFYSGGGGSVRGYKYQGIGPRDPLGNPTGGLSYAEGSLEARIGVTETVAVVPFIDAGTVSAKNFVDFKDVKLGAGVGLRYVTPFGPLRIDAAIPLNRGPYDPSFGIYAGVGQAF